MNKIEFVLGILVVLLNIFSVLAINSSVVPSNFDSEHYTYSSSANLSDSSFLFLFLVVFVTIGHAIYRKRALELGLSIVTLLWGFFAGSFIGVTIMDGKMPFIKGSPEAQLNEMSSLLIQGVVLGFALMLDGIIDTQNILRKYIMKQKK